jgi:aspartate racemase
MPNSGSGPKSIGIVACSAEGAALCYKTLCNEASKSMGAHAHPDVALHGHSLAAYVEYLDRGDLAGVAALMLSSASKLQAAGAQVLICPDNTIHSAMHLVNPQSPLPWLHIAEVVALNAVERGYRRIGITGTSWLVSSEVYPEQFAKLGLQAVRPRDEERDEINRLIMEELVNGIFSTAAVCYFQAVFACMKDEGCDAVVLGCTEIPLIMNDENSPLPTLDSTRLLARAALRYALSTS